MVVLEILARREPVRPLSAELLAEHRAEIAHALVAGRGAQRPAGFAFLVRIMDREDVGVGLLVLGDEKAFGGVIPVSTRVDPEHVDGRFTLDDPLGELPAGSAGRRDTKAVAFVEPEILQSPGRSDDRAAVGRIGDRTVEDLLDSEFAEYRDPPDRGLDVRRQALDVLLEELVFAFLVGPST